MEGDPFCAGGDAGEMDGDSDEEDAEGTASATVGLGETDGEATGAEEAFAWWRREDLGASAEDNGASEAKI